jgi:3-hydroxyisobutyrate dehydrogenase
MAQLAFLGLGTMGAPMAAWLVKAGHQVCGWNRSPGRAADFLARLAGLEGVAEGGLGRTAETVEEAVAGASVVLACVGDDPDAEEVALEAFANLDRGALYVDHTTTSARLARELSAIAEEAGIGWLDAPVSGGQAGAETGKLTVMCGGSEADFARAEPVVAAYAARIVRIGGAGAGQGAKMVNQVAIAGVLQGLAEAVHLAKAQGLDPDAVLEAISQGAAGSWQMANRWGTMVEGWFDFGFAVDWMRKDLRIVLEEARSCGARLPLTALVDQFYADVQAAGGGRLDTSSLVTRLTG